VSIGKFESDVPKPSRPGPGRPPGSKNRHPATRHDMGKLSNDPAPSTNEIKPDVKDQAESTGLAPKGAGRLPMVPAAYGRGRAPTGRPP
jgi:hypothetical protein